MIKYRIDILGKLAEAGYNTYILRRDKLLSEGSVQSIRNGEVIGLKSIDRICSLLKCQPGDLIEYVEPDEDVKPEKKITITYSEDGVSKSKTFRENEATKEEIMKWLGE